VNGEKDMDHRATEPASAAIGHPAGEGVALAPFDPEDSGDIAGEMFRRQVVQLAIDAYKVTVYRDLDPVMQLECFVAGALTGIVCVCFASIQDEGRDAIMEHLANCLPAARLQAENIREEEPSKDASIT